MVDPMDTLVKLQSALDQGIVRMQRCELDPNLRVLMDNPAGSVRITYASIEKGKVQGLAVFGMNGHIEDSPCFQVGYAVLEAKRQKGLASDLVKKGIEEMRNGFGRNGAKKFYVEAVVGVSNEPSNRLAKRLLAATPEEITDKFSGEPAKRYVKLIEC